MIDFSCIYLKTLLTDQKNNPDPKMKNLLNGIAEKIETVDSLLEILEESPDKEEMMREELKKQAAELEQSIAQKRTMVWFTPEEELEYRLLSWLEEILVKTIQINDKMSELPEDNKEKKGASSSPKLWRPEQQMEQQQQMERRQLERLARNVDREKLSDANGLMTLDARMEKLINASMEKLSDVNGLMTLDASRRKAPDASMEKLINASMEKLSDVNGLMTLDASRRKAPDARMEKLINAKMKKGSWIDTRREKAINASMEKLSRIDTRMEKAINASMVEEINASMVEEINASMVEEINASTVETINAYRKKKLSQIDASTVEQESTNPNPLAATPNTQSPNGAGENPTQTEQSRVPIKQTALNEQANPDQNFPSRITPPTSQNAQAPQPPTKQ